MFVKENSASIYLQGIRDRSMRSGTKFAREIKLTDWSTAGNLSNRSSGVQIPRDIYTRFGRYMYSRRCSWIIMGNISPRSFLYSPDLGPICLSTALALGLVRGYYYGQEQRSWRASRDCRGCFAPYRFAHQRLAFNFQSDFKDYWSQYTKISWRFPVPNILENYKRIQKLASRISNIIKLS